MTKNGKIHSKTIQVSNTSNPFRVADLERNTGKFACLNTSMPTILTNTLLPGITSSMEWSNGGLYIHYCWLSFFCLQLFYLLRYRYITFRSRFRKYLFLTFESPKAVTIVETSNMYEIMLLLILVM